MNLHIVGRPGDRGRCLEIAVALQSRGYQCHSSWLDLRGSAPANRIVEQECRVAKQLVVVAEAGPPDSVCLYLMAWFAAKRRTIHIVGCPPPNEVLHHISPWLYAGAELLVAYFTDRAEREARKLREQVSLLAKTP